jgi:SIR2-like domain
VPRAKHPVRCARKERTNDYQEGATLVLPVSDAIARFFSTATHPILFTGAGVSARAGLPSWKRLVELLAEGIRPFDPLTTQQMLERVRLGDYTLAVDYFKLSPSMVEGEKQKLLVRLLSSFDASRIVPIAQLPFRGCLTTNFDRSILDGIAAARHVAARDYRLGDASFKQAQWEEGLFVARVHGATEAPDSIVLSEAQFKGLLDDQTYADLLGSCFLHRNVLFLGFSFYDPAVRHIFDDLNRRFGSAPPGRHMALLPQGATSEFLQKAARLNIEVFQYDPKDDHAALWDGVANFNAEKAGSPTAPISKVAPFDFTKRYLAACYARAKTRESAAPLREAVAEGIVSAILQESAPHAVSRPDLQDKIRVTLGLSRDETTEIVGAATKSLVDAGLCRKLKGNAGRGSKFAWIGEPSDQDSLEAAIQILTSSVKKRAYLQEGWKTGKEVDDTMTRFYNELIRRRGWDLGAAFAAGRAPEGVSIESLLNECAIGLSSFDRERLLRICTGMLQHPSHEESDVLGELGRVSFAVELAFQSPRSTLLHKAILPRGIYFDASVLLPALVEGHPFTQIYRAAIKKLKSASSAAAVPLKLKICNVYLNEIISHRRNAVAYSDELGEDFLSVARADALYHGVPNVNVFVGAYANWVENNSQVPFREFLSRFAPYTTELQLRQWLKSQAFEIVDSFKGAKFAAFYSHLETAYANSLARGKGPILIEHDAIQLSILDAEILKGEKALFVTADRQLQSTVAGGKFNAVGETMISHVGLVQFIELVLGGMADGFGLTELLWSARISDRSQAVRSYFTSRGLEQYDDGLTMAMPAIIEKYADAAAAELARRGADLETDDPKLRAEAFRTLGSLERNYLSGMHEAVAKLRQEPVTKAPKR